MTDRNEKILELQEEIELLEAENEALAKRAEDIFLLGLISEAIGGSADEDGLIGEMLERISILKDIPYAAFGSFTGKQFLPRKSYSISADFEIFEDGFTFSSFTPGRPAVYVHSEFEAETKPGINMFPQSVCIIPFDWQVENTFILLASGKNEKPRLEMLVPLVERVSYLGAAHLKLISALAGLKAFNEELDQRVVQRTRDLEEANTQIKVEMDARLKAEKTARVLETQIAQTQKMEALGTLAGGIAHDFNNILAAIMGYADLARIEMSEDDSGYGSIQMITGAAERAKDMVRQILTFSRKAEASKVAFDLPKVLTEAVSFLRVTTPINVNLSLDVPDAELTVHANPTQIQQIVLNVGTNAFHAMGSEGGELCISMETVQPDALFVAAKEGMGDGEYYRVRFTDTGPGIEKGALDRIFEPFFTTKAKGEGTGMGLSVVHGIVSSIGGAIDVQSEAGKGTVFDVYLPISQPKKRGSVSVREGLKTGSGLVLLIDDDHMLLEVEESMITSLGYDCVKFTSSPEALEYFRENSHKIDIVVTDQVMPEMTGLELLAKLLEVKPELPVVLCSGYSEVVQFDEIYDYGAKAGLAKPFRLGDLAEVLAAALDSVV